MFGGKNSLFNKPFGTGSGSVNKAVGDAVGPAAKAALDAAGSASTLSINPALRSTGQSIEESKKLVGLGEGEQPKQLTQGEAEGFLEKGERKGEELTGATMAEVGEGRKDIRSRLQQILGGESAGASALKQDQQQQQKSFRAQQALSGGGQMNAGQQQALERKANIDHAKFVSDEKRRALADLSKEFRGAGGDIMRSSGQWGSVGVGMQPPASAGSSGGSSFVCTALKNRGMMSTKDSYIMLSLMLYGIVKHAKFFAWYFVNAKRLAEFLEYQASTIEMSVIKQDTVTDVIKTIRESGKELGAIHYIYAICTLAREFGCDVPEDLHTSSLMDRIINFPKLFFIKDTWVWTFNHYFKKNNRIKAQG